MTKFKVPEIKDSQARFGVESEKLLPPMKSIPEEFDMWHGTNPWVKFVEKWFYKGLTQNELDGIKPKEGIDKQAALKVINSIMRSWEPKHEHKVAGVAMLMDDWFTYEGPEIKR